VIAVIWVKEQRLRRSLDELSPAEAAAAAPAAPAATAVESR
jgi:hypothetical protein